ncbi:MAG TPA: M48 family metalloprotease [Vicinamibacterales bacterium]|jgi:Zn-dependent protease with chaperone function|nr:M48 family metalloprotease [Vicinamibacterales bacterium]
MLDDLPYGEAVALTIALIPALLQWWSGRAFVRVIDDPTLPERLAANQRRSGSVFGVAVGVLIVGWPAEWFWTIPLVVTGRIAAMYPLRRSLYNETWSFAGYLWFVARGLLAFCGFWLGLIWMPLFANLTGANSWLLAVGPAGLLLAWSVKSNDLVRFLLRARPIEDAALVSRFTALATAAGIQVPRFEYFDLRGGAIANAIALPGIRRSTVVFTDTLLAMLEPDEAVAICAHEIAHLEHYNPTYMRRAGLVTGVLIAIGVATIPLARVVESTTGIVIVWTGAIVLALIMRARFRQHHETESDLRAVALTGNADALISGLTKLHTFARIPRRWDATRERQATHPSLARRIRAIRAAAAVAPAPLTSTPSFSFSSEDRTLTLTEQALEIIERRNAATHVLKYNGLTELRLDAGKGKGVRLIAVQRDGKRWEIPVAASDLAAIQSALDVADLRLAEPEDLSRHWPRPVKVLAAFAALIALTFGQFAMLVLAALTSIEQSAPFLASAGVASVTSGLLTLRNSDPKLISSAAGLAALLIVFGGVLIWMAWSVRAEVKPRRMRVLLAVLTLCSVSGWAMLLSDGLGLVDFHHHARAWPAAAVFTLALATALATRPERTARAGAALTCAAGLFAAAAGSIAFLDRFATDPLLLPMASMPLKRIAGQPVRSFLVSFDVSEIILSPAGEYLALKSETTRAGDDAEVTTFHVGAAGEPLAAIEADDLVFADEDHVVLLEQRDGSARLRELSVTGNHDVVWQQEIEEIFGSTLSVDPMTGRWRILGWDDDGQLADVEGTLGTTDSHRTRWPLRESRDGSWPIALAASSLGPLVVNVNYETTALRGLWAPLRAFVGEPLRSTLTVRRADSAKSFDGGRSRLRADCFDETQPSRRILCSVYDGSRSRLIALNAQSDVPEPVGAIDGRFYSHRRVVNGWISGWLSSTPVAIRIAGPVALQVVQDGSGYVNELAANDTAFATVTANGESSTIRVYEQRR